MGQFTEANLMEMSLSSPPGQPILSKVCLDQYRLCHCGFIVFYRNVLFFFWSLDQDVKRFLTLLYKNNIVFLIDMKPSNVLNDVLNVMYNNIL